MKFGINALNFGPGATPKNLERWARFAEATGFHTLMISDHVAVTSDVQAQYPAPFYDPFTCLAWLAGLTSYIEIGTTVAVIPYRHPLHVARVVANIDQLSGGRFIFGAGIGWAKQEYEALGAPFGKRGAIANEYLEAIELCWAQDVATFHGRYVSFTNVHTGPRPARVPRPPVWIGGRSDAALRRAVLYGDAWHPIRFRVNWLRDVGLPRLKEIAAAEGKPTPLLCPRISVQISIVPMADDKRGAGQGTIEQIHSDLAGLESMGASYVILDTYSGDPETTKDIDDQFATLDAVASRIIDLENQKVRETWR